jgi:hypothetical protein
MAQLGIFKGDYALVKCKQDREQGRETDRETARKPQLYAWSNRPAKRARPGSTVASGRTWECSLATSSVCTRSAVCLAFTVVDSVQGITGDLFEGWLMPYFFQRTTWCSGKRGKAPLALRRGTPKRKPRKAEDPHRWKAS